MKIQAVEVVWRKSIRADGWTACQEQWILGDVGDIITQLEDDERFLNEGKIKALHEEKSPNFDVKEPCCQW